MALFPYRINAMTRGILSEDMTQRLDTDFYLKGLRTAKNIELLPQGPVRRRNGFAYLDDGFDSRAKLHPMRVSRSIQFQLIFQENKIDVYRNGVFSTRLSDSLKRIASITITAAGSGYAVDEALTFTGGGGSGAVGKVTSVGGSGEITGVEISEPGYDYSSAPTVGVTTTGGSGATFTIGMSDAFDVPWLWDDIDDLKITGSNETIYIFHPDFRVREMQRQSNDLIWTIDEFDESPEPSIKYTEDRGIKLKSSTGTVGTGRTLSADTSLFDSGWVGRWIYLRDGYGEITAFTSSTSVTWEITKEITTSATTFTESWEQSIESAEKGYAATGIIFQDRLYKMGFKSRPNTVAASQTSDFTNFDDVDPALDDSAFVFTINSDQSDSIQNTIARDNLQIFTDGTEWLLVGNPGITPTDISFELQTSVGSLSTAPLSVDNETYFVSRTGDQLMAFRYSFNQDSYITNNYSIVTGPLLSEPTQLSFHRSWLDSQANYVYCVNGDGDLILLAISVEQEILGWSKFETDGVIESAIVTTVASGSTEEDRLFVLVTRDGGTYLESMSADLLNNNAYIYLDSFVELGGDSSLNTTFTGASHLANQTVSVLNVEGSDLGDFTVAADGSVTIDIEEDTIYVGLPYTSELETMSIDIPSDSGVVRGQPHRMSYIDVDVRDTAYVVIAEGTKGDVSQSITFRNFETAAFDTPAPQYTGIERVYMDVYADESSGKGRQLSVKASSDRPLPFQINGFIIWLDV